jgi:hypothetical protein
MEKAMKDITEVLDVKSIEQFKAEANKIALPNESDLPPMTQVMSGPVVTGKGKPAEKTGKVTVTGKGTGKAKRKESARARANRLARKASEAYEKALRAERLASNLDYAVLIARLDNQKSAYRNALDDMKTFPDDKKTSSNIEWLRVKALRYTLKAEIMKTELAIDKMENPSKYFKRGKGDAQLINSGVKSVKRDALYNTDETRKVKSSVKA